jgi:hypothetical protein
MSSLRLAIFFLLLGGCASSQPPASPTAVDIDIGYSDSYSSSAGIYSRSMCAVDDVKKSYYIPQQQLIQIGELAEHTGFFSLPEYLRAEHASDDSISVTAPCATYALDIYHQGHHHRVEWSCETVHNGINPPQVREIFSAVMDALKPARAGIPASKCRYY